MVQKKITLDVWGKNNVFVKAVQGEVNSRFLEISLTDHGNNINLADKSVQVYLIKPDGKEIYNSATILDVERGTVLLELTSEMSNAHGTYRDAEIRVVSKNGETLKIKGLNLYVEKSMNDNAIESSSEFTALQVALGDVTSMKSHMNSTLNPHEVTVNQIGAISVGEKGTNGGVATLGDDGKLVQMPNSNDIGAIPVTDKGANNGVATLNGNGKLQASQLDISNDTYKIKLLNLSEEVQEAMAGTAPVVSSVEDGSLTSNKYANNSVLHGKLGTNYMNCWLVGDTQLSINTINKTITLQKTKSSNMLIVSNKRYWSVPNNQTISYTSGSLNIFWDGVNSMLVASPNTLTFTSKTCDMYYLGWLFETEFYPADLNSISKVLVNGESIDKYIKKTDLITTEQIKNLSITDSKLAETLLSKINSSATVKIVAADGSRDYTTINSAVQEAEDGDTILVMPGTYIEAVEAFSKMVHIVGVNKYSCILKNSTGVYLHSPLEIGAGSVNNMTIYAEKPADYVQDENDTVSRLQYAVHVESERLAGNVLEFNNCILKSDWYAALGFGLRKDCKLILRNCELIGKSLQAWNGESWLISTALFGHDAGSWSSNMGDNQRLILENCVIKSASSVVFRIGGAWGTTGNKTYLTFHNNILWSEINGKQNVILKDSQPTGGAWCGNNIYLTKDSFGNNVSELND